jgi:hypothetical protein
MPSKLYPASGLTAARVGSAVAGQHPGATFVWVRLPYEDLAWGQNFHRCGLRVVLFPRGRSLHRCGGLRFNALASPAAFGNGEHIGAIVEAKSRVYWSSAWSGISRAESLLSQ